MSFGSLILPKQYPDSGGLALWLYAHTVSIDLVPGSSLGGLTDSTGNPLTAKTIVYETDLYGNLIPIWDLGPDGEGGGREAEIEWMGKSEAHRTVLCSAADRWRLVQAYMGGYAGSGTTGSGNYGSYNQTGLFLDPAPAIGGGTVNMAMTKYAKLHITYKSLDWFTEDQGSLALDFADETYAPGSGSGFTWGDGPHSGEKVPGDLNPSISVSVITFTRVLKQIPQLPISQILAASNTLNSTTFYGCSTKKIRFVTCKSVSRAGGWSAAGGQLWDVEYLFKARQVEWDKIYDFSVPGWQTITPSPFSNGLFDYNTLFPSTTQQPIG